MEDAAQTAPTPQTLHLIRLAILGTVLLFGAVAWFLTSSGVLEPLIGAETAAIFQYVFYIAALGSLGGFWFARQRLAQAATASQRAQALLLGYALGEMPAMIGAVYLLLTGGVLLFAVGVLVLLVAFLLFPIQPEAA